MDASYSQTATLASHRRQEKDSQAASQTTREVAKGLLLLHTFSFAHHPRRFFAQMWILTIYIVYNAYNTTTHDNDTPRNGVIKSPHPFVMHVSHPFRWYFGFGCQPPLALGGGVNKISCCSNPLLFFLVACLEPHEILIMEHVMKYSAYLLPHHNFRFVATTYNRTVLCCTTMPASAGGQSLRVQDLDG